ncbi:MAG: arsenic resistance N-acetyltransferase ArsN2 [Gemmatimonadota bacterium]
MNIRVRAAQAHDLPAVTALLAEAELPRDGVAESFGDFFVAESAGEVIGAAGLEIRGRDALLRSVVVAPAAQGHAVGHQLTARAIAEARARGLEKVWLLTISAIGFFPRFGFRQVPREKVPDALQATVEFHHACPATAAVLVRRAQPLRVLILCTANVARSQLAEALLLHRGGDLVMVASAGAVPGRAPHPMAREVLAERGIIWEGKHSKGIDEVASAGWDLVITVCDAARDACPILPGATMVHWGLEDPVSAGADDATLRQAFRETAAALDTRFAALLELPLAILDHQELAREAAAIHARS